MKHNLQKARFIAEENGAGTVFAIFLFICLCVLTGLMIDATNGWRNSTMLSSAADAGSHAGAVELATSGDEVMALAVARNSVRANLPPASFGDIAEATDDIYLLSNDAPGEAAVALRTAMASIRRTAKRAVNSHSTMVQAGIPLTKFVVPSIGSITQENPLSPGAPPCSSP